MTDNMPEVVGDGCECWVTPQAQWFYYGSAVEPGSQAEWNPECPKHNDDDDDTCVYCHCPIESHTINGCDECPCGMSEFWDDGRGDE